MPYQKYQPINIERNIAMLRLLSIFLLNYIIDVDDEQQ